jgi:hypothetical protein
VKPTTKLWIGLGALALLSPLGVILPEKLKAGGAWGEWGAEEFKGLVGYVPSGLRKLSSFWNSIMPDYAIKGWEDKGLGHLSVSYIIAAVAGAALCAAAAFFLGRWLARKNK